MRDAVLAIVFIGGFFLLRAVLATIFFFYLLPEGLNCPNCDAITIRVESRKINFLMPRFRTSWCLDCGWHGLLRETNIPAAGQDRIASPKKRSVASLPHDET